MEDVIRRNPGTISGTPSLISSMLARDDDAALRFSGGSSFSVPHSSTLNLLNGAVGGIALSFMLNVPAHPVSEKFLFQKAGEYGASIKTDGTLRFYLNGAARVDSSAPIPLNTDVLVSLIYNGGYTGTPQVGKTTTGATQTTVQPDYRAGATTGSNNLQVCQFQLLERGLLTQIVMSLQRHRDAPTFQDMAAVMYADSAGAPGAKLAQSAGQYLGSTALGTQPIAWVAFPIDSVILEQNDYVWLGYAGGANHSGDTTVMTIGLDSSGGVHKGRNSVVSASSAGPASQAVADPFGTAALSDDDVLAVYADYTPLARTGDEGHALIYLDGQEDNRAAYSSGITAGTNALTGPQFDVRLDELLLWDRKLGPVEVAQLYAAR